MSQSKSWFIAGQELPAGRHGTGASWGQGGSPPVGHRAARLHDQCYPGAVGEDLRAGERGRLQSRPGRLPCQARWCPPARTAGCAARAPYRPPPPTPARRRRPAHTGDPPALDLDRRAHHGLTARAVHDIRTHEPGRLPHHFSRPRAPLCIVPGCALAAESAPVDGTAAVPTRRPPDRTRFPQGLPAPPSLLARCDGGHR